MPSTRLKNILYRTALPFAAPSSGTDPLLPVSGHRINDLNGLSRIIRRHHMLGGSVLISDGKDFSLVFERPSSVRSPDADSYFRVASITKMATALLSLLLVHDGLVDPDEPVARYLPESDGIPDLDGVSLRHLLSHTSGLSDPPDLEKKLEAGLPYRDAVSGARFADPGTVFHQSPVQFRCGVAKRRNHTDPGDCCSAFFHIFQHYVFSSGNSTRVDPRSGSGHWE